MRKEIVRPVNEIMKVISENFTNYHMIYIANKSYEDDPFSHMQVVQIMHENKWKDVWIEGNEINKIVVVNPDIFGEREEEIWRLLKEKEIVRPFANYLH